MPHVLDVVEAMNPETVLIQEDLLTDGADPPADRPSNIAKRVEFGHGDVEVGFAKADVIVEREFNTRPVHQGYIEPHACVASVSEDGQAELWCSTQGHYVVRGHCARVLGMDVAKLRVTASELGGGFGGKTAVYLEPVALALSRKACQPVKMVMTREEVFKASGPTSGANMRVKIGATRDGQITAGEAILHYQAGAFQGSPVQPGAQCAFAPYDLEHVRAVGFDVLVNRPKTAAYRRQVRLYLSTLWNQWSMRWQKNWKSTPLSFDSKMRPRKALRRHTGQHLDRSVWLRRSRPRKPMITICRH